MQITHEQARRLIQFHADDSLNLVEKNLLEDHLNSCPECRKYAGSIQKLELILRPLMQKRWNQRPLPLPTLSQASRKKFQIPQDIILVTRIVAMCVICMAVLINIWQFTQSTSPGTGGPSVSVPPAPTPSIQTTNTTVHNQECKQFFYPVRDNDTLDSIASQFSVTKQEILSLNELSAEKSLTPSMVLRIPLCTSTPAGTPNTIMTLFTPRMNTTTSTPVGSPTQ